MNNERRQQKRVSLFRDYCYYPENRRKRFSCSTKNISITGACIISDTKLNINDIVNIRIMSDRETVFKSRVVWELEGTYGLQFLLETNEDFDNISYIMNNYAKQINR